MKTIKKRYISEKIKDLFVLELDTFQDFRGEIWTLYSNEHSDLNYVADKVTISRFGVLRGFHGDPYTAKLITCLSGQFQLSVVDLRGDSDTYGATECVFYYKWSEDYNGPESQVTVMWDDPDLGVDWVIKNPILSERDKNGRSYKEIKL